MIRRRSITHSMIETETRMRRRVCLSSWLNAESEARGRKTEAAAAHVRDREREREREREGGREGGRERERERERELFIGRGNL